MAGKKVLTVNDSVNIFKDVMNRAGMYDFIYSNRIMISKNLNNGTAIIVPEQDLWNALIDDSELKPHMVEYDESKHGDLRDKFSYGTCMDEDIWISIDPALMYQGEIINISIKGFEYKVPINRALIPVRLKKVEYSHFSYRISRTNDAAILIMRKKFEAPVPNTNFNMLTIYQVV